MTQATSVTSKSRKSLLLGTSALVCFALAAPVMADDFVITSGNKTNAGNTINGNDTVAVTGALVTTGVNEGIDTTGGTNTVSVSEAGSIETAGAKAYGILNIGDSNETTVSGSITTAGQNAYGIYNLGDKNATTVSGDIETTGNAAFGIFNKGNGNKTTVSGSITTTGAAADGIFNNGDGNKTTVSGSVKVTGVAAYGIFNFGNGNKTTISGNITASGAKGFGLRNEGNGNNSTVSGNIKASGKQTMGLFNVGNKNTAKISGSITTAGNSAYGIYNLGDKNATTVSGSITTAGVNAEGILNAGDGNVTTVSGSITTSGKDGDGVVNEGGNNTTTISGNITASGAEGFGLLNVGNGNNSTVSGNIKASGKQSMGLANEGNKNTAKISGSIVTTGNSSFGIFQIGGTNTTTISGTVSATGSDANALINYSGSGNSFTLNEGAVIIGDISAASFSTNNKLKFNLGASSSYAYTVGGAGEGTGSGEWKFTDQDGRTQGVTSINKSNCTTTPDYDDDGEIIIGSSIISVCNLVTGLSTGNLEVQDELQFSMNTAMIGSLSLGSNNSTAPVEAMSFAQTPQSSTWFNIYGDTSERSASTTKLTFDASNSGFTIGTPVSISDMLNLDVAFNASNADLDIGSAKEQEIAVVSYNIGAVLRDLVPSNAWSVDAFGFLGSNSYEGKRKVMNNKTETGSESVTASYSGMEVLLGVDAQYSNPINDTLNFTGGLNASLSNEKIGAYSESKYFSWDARTMTQAAGGINLGLEYNKDALTTFASLGLQHSSLQKGKTATYTNNGTAGSFIDNATSDTRRSATVGFSYKATENIAFKGAVEAFTSENGVDGNSANLSLNWRFGRR